MPLPGPAPDPLLPPLALAAFLFTAAGVGALANCAVLAALFKHHHTGLYSLITQLALADTLMGVALVPELWSSNSRTWRFGSKGCTAYQGLTVFTSTATLYLVVAIALHTIATINFQGKTSTRRFKKANDDEEIRSSSHSLVANSDSSTPPRSMNIDYRIATKKIPTILPTVFVWILSASLSVPEFVLSSTVYQKNGLVACTLDSDHRLNMHYMLAMFTLFLPLFIMTTCCAIIIVKLKSKKLFAELDNCELTSALKLSLWLIVVQVIFCAPRSFLSVYSAYSGSENDYNKMKVELPQWSDDINTILSLSFSSGCLLTVLIRPILYVVFLSRLRKIFGSSSEIGNNV